MNRINDSSEVMPSVLADSKGIGVDTLKLNLERAAELATSNGLTAEVFSQLAFNAYASKNPEFREQLETMHITAQIELLRAQGRLGLA